MMFFSVNRCILHCRNMSLCHFWLITISVMDDDSFSRLRVQTKPKTNYMFTLVDSFVLIALELHFRGTTVVFFQWCSRTKLFLQYVWMVKSTNLMFQFSWSKTWFGKLQIKVIPPYLHVATEPHSSDYIFRLCYE